MKGLLPLVGIALLPATLLCQDVTGALTGRIVTLDGTPVAGADVILSGPHLMRARTTHAGENGTFYVPALPVGEYRVIVRRIGYRPLIVEAVPIVLGRTATLTRVVLEPQPSVELPELVVTARQAGFDASGTVVSSSFDATLLEALPLPRNYRDVALLAPTAVPSFAGDGVNIGGATGYENAYFVDGINVTSPINGATSIDLPWNFIQQIDVRAGAGTPGDGQAPGGVINVVTPSGSNRFEASAMGFWSGDPLQATGRTILGSTQTGFSFYDAALTLSGPIRRDRLWFFAGYDRNLEHREHTFGFGRMMDRRAQHLYAGKLTWQPADHTTATLTVLGDPGTTTPLDPPPFAAGAVQNREVLETTGRTGGTALALRFEHLLAPGLLLEASGSRLTRGETYLPATAAGRAPYVIDVTTGTFSGGRGSGSEVHATRRAASLSLRWRPRRHTIRLGGMLEVLDNIMTFCGGRTTCGGDITKTSDTSYTWHTFQGDHGHGRIRNPVLHAQDAMEVTPWLTLSGGLRWSRQDVSDAARDSVNFRIRDGLQPHLGVATRLGRAGAHRVFASWAITALQLSLWNAGDYAVGYESLLTFSQDPRGGAPYDGVNYTFTFGAGFPADGALRGQTSAEYMLGYAGRIRGLGVSVRMVRRELRDAVAEGSSPGGTVWGNPGRGLLSAFPESRRRYEALELALEHIGALTWRASWVMSRNRGNYPGVFISDWGLPGPTAHAGPLFIVPSQWVNSDGLLPNDRRHVVKLYGSGRLPWGLSAGASLLVASGTPRTEYGAIPEIGSPFRGFASPRGTAGRTPAIWDLGARISWDLPWQLAARARMILDLEHVGSPQAAIDYQQQHYTCVDASGAQSCARADYGTATRFQPPMTARVGVILRF